ncbi:MAG: aspartate--tRNA ligase [Erysipelotrichaceae bacterium]|nr:aspartate--tRNA ligase [Erysipelotrichaceae bacterium]
MNEKFERTNHCGDLRLADVGKSVIVIGWVQKRRNLGSLVFIDLRDRWGIVQVVVKPEDVELPDIRNEYIIQVFGKISKKDVPNKNLATGDIEIVADKVVLINTSEQPPIVISDDTDASEDIRLKYRYLDLRRQSMVNRFLTRAKITKCAHDYFSSNDFVNVETPYLSPSTPEGARDYLVPSRLKKGSFYALPQSPQLFKQMLMVAGFDRYYQVARCFRDEDLRADRQPDFTQIDVEMSFMNEDEILAMAEGFLKKVFKEVVDFDVQLPLRHMEYDDAVNFYGSDKPDTRFGMKLVDLKDILDKTEFGAWKDSKFIKAIKIEGIAEETSRKKQDEYNLLANKFGMKFYACFKVENDTLEGSLVKFMNPEQIKNVIQAMDVKNGDVIFVGSGNDKHNVCFGVGALRSMMAKKLNLIKPNTFDLLWVVHFPLFEKSEETGEIVAVHHPFTRPCDEDLSKLRTDPFNVYAYAYDIVINGYEAGGGSLRIYDQKVQQEIFEILGLTPERIQKKFGWFVDALKFGTPPHGGLAFGLDRLTMILSGTDNIRDVIAFPKNLAGVCPVTNAPYPVDEDQLKVLGIDIIKEK